MTHGLGYHNICQDIYPPLDWDVAVAVAVTEEAIDNKHSGENRNQGAGRFNLAGALERSSRRDHGLDTNEKKEEGRARDAVPAHGQDMTNHENRKESRAKRAIHSSSWKQRIGLLTRHPLFSNKTLVHSACYFSSPEIETKHADKLLCSVFMIQECQAGPLDSRRIAPTGMALRSRRIDPARLRDRRNNVDGVTDADWKREVLDGVGQAGSAGESEPGPGLL